jgi:hypothetical protein
MHGPYPGELRLRVIDFVEGGGSRRGAAEQFEVSVSHAPIGGQCVRDWNGFDPPGDPLSLVAPKADDVAPKADPPLDPPSSQGWDATWNEQPKAMRLPLS